MTNLIRPEQGRIVGGVASGIAEYYRLNTGLVRAVALTAIIASPIVLLIYLLLWIGMPSELSVLGELHYAGDEPTMRSRFEKFSSALLLRTGVMEDRRVVGKQVFAFALLLVAFVLELPQLEGVNFYYLHPILTTVYTSVDRHAAAAFYLTVAFAFFAIDRIPRQPVELHSNRTNDLLLDRGETREIGGLIAGLARVTDLDPAYLRVIFVFLNILTFGVVGIIYLLTVYYYGRKGRVQTHSGEYRNSESIETHLPPLLRYVVGFLFLALALIRVTTEFRLFFFNEPFFRGLALSVVGLIFSLRALRHAHQNSLEKLWLLGGATILFAGIYDFASAVFQVQLPFAARFEVCYVIGALAFLYFTIVSLSGKPQWIGFAIVLLLFLCAALVQFNIAPAKFLLALVQFYGFFFPVMFAGFGLWLVMER